jgi:hypothetical protein
MALNEEYVIRNIKDTQPKSAQALLDDCMLPVKYIGGGCFRDGYQILGTSLLVKIPRLKSDNTVNNGNVLHAVNEWDAFQRISKSKGKRLQALKPHLPEFLHHDPETGVTVVRKYRKRPAYNAELESWMENMRRTIRRSFKVMSTDLHDGNLRIDKEGTLRFIDLGMFAHSL